MGAKCCIPFANITGLGCCMDMDTYKQIQLAEVIPNERRHCTDVPCLLIFIAAIVLEGFIAYHAYQSGANPHLITDGYDYELNMCQLVVWPSLSEYNIRVCIDETSSCNAFTNDAKNPIMIDTYPSKQFLNSYCIPTDLGQLTGTEYEKHFDSTQQTFEHALIDLGTAKWLIITISFLAILLSFIYVKIIACVGRFLVWFTVCVIVGGGGVLAYFLMDEGLSNMKHKETEFVGKWQVGFGAAVILVEIIVLLIVFFERKNIEIVIQMLQEASHAMTQLPFTLCTPIYFSIIALIFTFGWGLEFAYIYSVKTEVGPNTMPQSFIDNGNYPNEYWHFTFDLVMESSLCWHVFIWLFVIQFIVYLAFMTLAGVFAEWYFSDWTDEEHTSKELKHSWPICKSFCTAVRFHLGSIAFAALILTVIRAIRAALTYIEKKMSGTGSPIGKCLFGCVHCCLGCCEWIFDKINKNGLIFITIYGTSYCYASYSSLKLVLENLDTMVMVEAVTTASEILGKFMITLGLTALSVVCMAYYPYYKTNLSSYLIPAVLVFVICYLVSSLFMAVFEVAVETIYLSYLIDEKVNGGTSIFATGQLPEIKKRASMMEGNTDLNTDLNTDGGDDSGLLSP